ncbi:MAG: tyrosine-type recombinase/integrase, partial [Candidatus Latescibacteria bacterium]|nr:tyrosine-type recombinase/integrase [Candidatus Latescibacterota bacterium]
MPTRNKGEQAKDRNGRVLTGVWHQAHGDGFVAEVSFKDPHTGKRARTMRRFNRRDLAVDWRNNQMEGGLRVELDRQKSKGRSMRFNALTVEYLEWSSTEKKESSYLRDQISVKHLKDHFGKKAIGDISRRDVERYVAQRRKTMIGVDEKRRFLKPATVNRELCCMKNMLRKAVDWDYIESNPAWGVKQAKEDVPEFEFLTYDEATRVVEVSAPHIRTFLALALNTGMRKGELFKLQWKDVKLDKCMITVRDTKNHETRYVPINKKLDAALRAHPRRIIDGRKCPYVLSNEEGKPYQDLRGSFKAA